MYICNGTTWAPSTGDATAEPKVLMFTGTGWPDRPASARPTLFVGGTSADAPTDADLRNGDMWISEEGLSLVAWEGITNKPDYIAAGDTDYEAREAIGAAAAADILPSGTAGRAVLEADTQSDVRTAADAVRRHAIDARDYIISGTTIDFAAVIAAMEAQRRACFIPGGAWNIAAKANLMNHASVTQTYYFFGDGGGTTRLTLPSGMVDGEFAFGVNVDSSGNPGDSSLYPHPEIVFENIAFSGTPSPNATVLRVHQRGVALKNVQFRSLKNGVITSGYCDRTQIENVYADTMTDGGWIFQQTGFGDGLIVNGLHSVYCGGLYLKKMNGGVVSGLVSGWHQFDNSDVEISGVHLEGDGGGTAATMPVLTIRDSRVALTSGMIFTRASAPAIVIDDNNGSGRWSSSLTIDRELHFQQRLDDPGSTVGNRLGTAIYILKPAKETRMRLNGVRQRIFRQNATVSNVGFEYLVPVVSTPNSTTDEVAILSMLTSLGGRRAQLSTICELQYKNNAWEIGAPEPMSPIRPSRRVSSSTITLAATADNPMTAGWTTLTAGTYYYRAWTTSMESLNTAGATEVSCTIDGTNPVPRLDINVLNAPCRLRIVRGTSPGTYTQWAEVYVSRETLQLFDQGDAIAGSAWSGTSLPSPPSVNSTYDGFQVRGSGKRQAYLSAAPTDGAWSQGDLVWNTAPVVGGVRGWVCTTAGTPGTWSAFPDTAAELHAATAKTDLVAADELLLGDSAASYGLKKVVASDLWRYIKLADPDIITSGESTLHRSNINTTTVNTTNGYLRLTYFTALKTETITQIRSVSGGTAAVTPTLCRIGIYTIDGSGNLTLAASIASDTSLWAAQNTEYLSTLSASFSKVVGTRYAIGHIVVGAGTAPTLTGHVISTVAVAGRSPRICGYVSGQTDLPSSVSVGSINDHGARAYMELVP